MPTLISNFELLSKLPNFTRDSFADRAEMYSVDPDHMDEGHISYCAEDDKHYIYRTDKNNNVTWTELIPNTLIIDDIDDLTDAHAQELNPGSLVFVQNKNKLYYRTNEEYNESQDPPSGYFVSIPNADEILDNYPSRNEIANEYLSKATAENTYLTIGTAKEDYLTKSSAADTYLTIGTAEKNYLTKNDATDTYLTKNDANDKYVQLDDVQHIISGYRTNHPDSYVGVDIAEGLYGELGRNINNAGYSINQILDKIIFKECLPVASAPSLEIDLNLNNWNPNLTWYKYDGYDRILLLPVGSQAPQQVFNWTNMRDSQFTSLNGTVFNHTHGLNIGEQNAPNTKVVCSMNNNGEWEELSVLPSTFSEPGEYRYYYAAHFKKGYPIMNNHNEVKTPWNEYTKIESKNYITVNVSRPTKKNTPSGMVNNPIVYWEDEMVDYFELEPTCSITQTFQTPREAKKIYVWNDLCGYAEDLSFTKTQISNGYYEYTYDHTNKGHRGKIKIKVEF